MPASDIKQLFNFENNIERAVQSILQAAGYAETFIEGSNAVLPPSRLEVTFSTGDTLNEAALANGDHVYDFFNGSLVIRIVTERPANQPSLLPGVSSLHEEFAAGVRAALQERVSPFTPANLPYYAVKTIRPRPTQRDLDPRWLEDFTRLEFLVEFGIRSDQWPA